MSKPLELTVYEIDRTAPSMVVVDGFWEYRPYDPAKRLTDAELAAEYWNAEAHRRCIWANMDGLEDLAYGERAWDIETKFHEFATLPHYDEQP